LTLLAFLLTLAGPASAQGGSGEITMEQAMAIAKSNFEIPKDLNVVSQGMRDDEYMGRKIYDFQWSSERPGKYVNVNVAIDAVSGEVLSYYYGEDWRPEKIKKLPKPMSRDQAQKLAEAFARKIQPGLMNQVKLQEPPRGINEPYYPEWGPRIYNFTYQRLVNGIPFGENAINIGINAHTGKLMNYSFNWDKDVLFPDAAKALEQAKAEEIFREKLGLNLRYQRIYGWYGPIPNYGKNEIKLYYTPENYPYGSSGLIDAYTGKVVDNLGKEVTVGKKVYVDFTKGPGVSEDIKDKKPLSQEEAKALVAKYLEIPSDYRLTGSRYYEGWGNGAVKMWEFNYSQGGPGWKEPINVGIDAVTGELRNFNFYVPWQEGGDKPVNFNKEQSKEIAVEFLKKVAPQKFDQVVLMDNPSEPGYWFENGKKRVPPVFNFTFQRTVYGIPLNDNSISININNETGKVTGFWMNWEPNLKFASPAGIITEKQAVDTLMAANKLELTYVRKQREDGMPSKEVMLVYSLPFNQPTIVDAATGKLLTQDELQNPVKLDDLQGHWAQREIMTLAAAGIVSGSNGKFKPESAVTRAEFIKLLVAAKGLEPVNPERATFSDVPARAWHYGYVEAAAKAGIIKGEKGKFFPEKLITREEMAVMVMRSLNMGDADESVLDFKDNNKIAPWAKEAVALAVEMGFLNGKDGYFKPLDKATRAEAAVFMFRVLERTSVKGMMYAKVVG